MKYEVLDHGYVELIESWGKGKAGGCDRLAHRGEEDYEVGIIEAARQSTQGSFRGWDEDKRLLRTLYNHQSNQSTPFEAAGMTIEVQAPIMVFREWHRHRTQSYNEASARYKPLPPICYTPIAQNVVSRSIEASISNNKQAGSEYKKSASKKEVDEWLYTLETIYASAEAFYRYGLGLGIPKEIARLAMPVGHYSCMRATANLRNWLAFLTLRLDPKAQWEIRQYAGAVYTIMKVVFPRTMEIFDEQQGRT